MSIAQIPLHEFYKTKSNFRKVKYQFLARALMTNFEFKKLHLSEQQEICKKIEKSCYKYCIKQRNIDGFEDYDVAISKICTHLDFSINGSYLCNKILKGELSLSKIAILDSSDFYLEKDVKIREDVEKRKNQNLSVKTTKMYICEKCKNDEHEIRPLQTRALDEGNGFLTKCTKCHFSRVR